MHNVGYEVLVLDVRTREEFEKEHMKASAIVCLEPLVLKREKYVSVGLHRFVSLNPPKHHRRGH